MSPYKPGCVSRVGLARLPFEAQHPNCRPSADATRRLRSDFDRAVEKWFSGLLNLPRRVVHGPGCFQGVPAAMILVLRHAFKQAVFYADVLWNDTVHFVVGLITQAVENCPFRRIDGSSEEIIEENDGSG
jgi:hypothetical protein